MRCWNGSSSIARPSSSVSAPQKRTNAWSSLGASARGKLIDLGERVLRLLGLLELVRVATLRRARPALGVGALEQPRCRLPVVARGGRDDRHVARLGLGCCRVDLDVERAVRVLCILAGSERVPASGVRLSDAYGLRARLERVARVRQLHEPLVTLARQLRRSPASDLGVILRRGWFLAFRHRWLS